MEGALYNKKVNTSIRTINDIESQETWELGVRTDRFRVYSLQLFCSCAAAAATVTTLFLHTVTVGVVVVAAAASCTNRALHVTNRFGDDPIIQWKNRSVELLTVLKSLVDRHKIKDEPAKLARICTYNFSSIWVVATIRNRYLSFNRTFRYYNKSINLKSTINVTTLFLGV